MSPTQAAPAPTPSEDRGVKAKEAMIMEAALSVFTEKGFHPATIDEIAERAGVGKGTIYSYFKSKASLMEQLIETSTREHLEEAARRVGAAEGAREQLYALAAVDRAYLKRHGALARMLVEGSAGLSPEFHAHMAQARARILEMVADVVRLGQSEGIFRPSLNPDVVASMILGVRSGIICDWILDRRNKAPEVMNDLVLDFILHGLSSHEL